MLESLFTSTVAETLTIGGTITVILSALILGLIISLVYIYTHINEDYTKSFTVTLIMLPIIIAMIILLVGNNVARAFSLAGAFSLIRFRSAPGDSKDIAYVFFTLGVGLACGMGYIAYAALFTLILCVVMVVLTKLDYGFSKSMPMKLKIIIPEDMNFTGLFDDILLQYTKGYKLIRVKTCDFGTMYELCYNVKINEKADQKAFIDKLRTRNGNLNILLTMRDNEE